MDILEFSMSVRGFWFDKDEHGNKQKRLHESIIVICSKDIVLLNMSTGRRWGCYVKIDMAFSISGGGYFCWMWI